MNLEQGKTQCAAEGVSALELANAIAQYSSSYDTYEYRDNVDDPEQFVAELEKDILSGNIDPIVKYLERDIEERDDVDGLHAAVEVLIMRLHQYEALRKEQGLSFSNEANHGKDPRADVVNNGFEVSLNIGGLHELYDTITRVVNHVLETGAKNTDSGNCIVKYDDVSHLLNEDDFNRYFLVIAGELMGREEVQDLSADGFTGQINFVVGPEWCPNYKPLSVEAKAGLPHDTKEITKKPTLTERLATGFTVPTENPDLVEVFCYADQVLPKTDRAELFDSHYNAHFVVPKSWAEEQAKLAGYKDLKEFFDDYTWDTTDGWYEKAFHDGVLLGVGLGIYSCNQQTVSKDASEKPSFDQKISQARVTAEQQNFSQPPKFELVHKSNDR